MATYELFCMHCNGPDWKSDQVELPAAQCPKCGKHPTRFSIDGEWSCWIHRRKLLPYAAEANALFIHYWWCNTRDRFSFPNAKLFDPGPNPRETIEMDYCVKCQELYANWLHEISEASESEDQ
jgi:hypothetical protein